MENEVLVDISRRDLVKLLGAAGLSTLVAPNVLAQERSVWGMLSYADGRAWLHPDARASSLGPLIFDSGAHASTVWRNAESFVSRERGTIEVASIGEKAIREKIDVAQIALSEGFSLQPHFGIKALIDHITVSDIVLGTAAFANLTFSLNFANSTYSINTQSVNRSDYPDYFRANIFRYGQVFTRFYNSKINDRKARGILDTGSRITTLYPKLVERLSILETAVELGPKTFITGSTGKITVAQYVKVPKLEIADQIFENHWCVAVIDKEFKQHGSPEYLIGMDIASQFHIVWDLIGPKRVYLKRKNPQPPPPLKLLAGRKITSRDGHLWLYDDVDIETAGIETIDDIFSQLKPLKIVKIPGVEFGQPSSAFQYAQFRDTSGPLKFMVDDHAGIREIEIDQLSFT